jgi:hypothetical protein
MTTNIFRRLNGNLAPWTQRLLLVIVLGFSGWLVSQVEKINDFSANYVQAEDFRNYQATTDHSMDEGMKALRQEIIELRKEMNQGFSEVRTYIYNILMDSKIAENEKLP